MVSCVAISPRARRIAQLMVMESDVRELMQRVWGANPVNWEHEVQHMLMRKAVHPLAAVLPTLRFDAAGPPAASPLALGAATLNEDNILTNFLRDYKEQAN